MTRPSSITARAEYLAAELKGIVDALPAYSSANPGLTVRSGLALTRMVADLARLVEQQGES